MLKRVNRHPKPRELRSFALVTLMGFAVIGGLLWWSGRHHHSWAYAGSRKHITAIILWGLAALVAAVTLAAPAAGRYLYIGWMTLATWMGTVMSFILLTIFYFVLLPPFALLRLRDPLRMKRRAQDSYWVPYKSQDATIERAQHPF